MTLHTKNLSQNIVLVQADSQYELGSVFLRFQEFYENPEFRDKIFTLGEFRQWYAETYGAFTYASDWTGFNIPSYVIDKFKTGIFDPLTPGEQELITLFKDRADTYYVIGAQGDEVLEHEICHGLFYTNGLYRAEVSAFINSNPHLFTEVFDFVRGMMYHPSVYLDEVHAYATADYDFLKEKNVHLDKEAHDTLRLIKSKHYDFRMS